MRKDTIPKWKRKHLRNRTLRAAAVNFPLGHGMSQMKCCIVYRNRRISKGQAWSKDENKYYHFLMKFMENSKLYSTRTNASKWNTYACPLSATPQPHAFTARTTRWEINCTSFDDDATKSVAESFHRKTEPNGVDARWVVTLGWLQKWTCVCIRVTSRWRVESQYQINRTVSFRIAMTLSLFIYEKTKTFLFVQHKMVTQMMINIIQLRKWKEIV